MHNAERNGVYTFTIKEDATINLQRFNNSNDLEIWDVEILDIKVGSDTEILLMEVPLK